MADSHAHAVECSHCGGKWFREDRIVQLNASVMVTSGMKVPAQTVAVGYQYTCLTCQHVVDEHFVQGRLTEV